MKRLLALSSAIVFLMGWLGFAEAAMHDGCKCMGGHEMGRHMDKPGDHPLMRMMASLGLDDNQKNEIEAIHLRCKKEVIKKRADIAVAEIELKEILAKEPADISAAESKIKAIESMKADLRILRMKAHQEIKSKLTPEQRKRLSEMREAGGMGPGMMHPCMTGMKGMKGEKPCGHHMMRGGPRMDTMGGGDPEGDEEPSPEPEHQHQD